MEQRYKLTIFSKNIYQEIDSGYGISKKAAGEIRNS